MGEIAIGAFLRAIGPMDIKAAGSGPIQAARHKFAKRIGAVRRGLFFLWQHFGECAVVTIGHKHWVKPKTMITAHGPVT